MKRLILILVVILTTLSIKAQLAAEWTAVVGLDYNQATHTLTKTAGNGWNTAGARSVNRLDANEDGKFTYTITETTTRKAIGLSTLNDDQKIRSIDYAFVFNKKKLLLYKHGKIKGQYGNFQVGDAFEMERLGDKIVCKKNGNTFRQLNTNPEHTLYIDLAVHTSGTVMSGITTNFYTPINITRNKQDVVCGGGANGAIDITVTGGLAPYAYSWDNGAVTEDITNLDIAKYTVTVTDAQGKQATKSINIQAPIIWNDVTGLAKNNNNLSKNTTDGWNAGAASHNQLLANQKGFVQYEADQTGVIKAFGLSTDNTDDHYNTIDYGILLFSNWVLVVENGNLAGFYGTYEQGDQFRIVRKLNGNIKYKKNGEVFKTTTADPNQQLLVDLALYSSTATFNGIKSNFCNVDALSISYVEQEVSHSGDELGAIDVTITGGIEPYTYLWSSGETTQDLDGLSAGTYTVTVTDGAGNTKEETIVIYNELHLAYTTVDVTNGGTVLGSIDITVTGGLAPYTYAWSNDAATEDLTELIAGDYTVTVTDARGIIVVETIEIINPFALSYTVVEETIEELGAIDLTVSGGVPPYTYLWNDGTINEDRSNLESDIYTVTVVDSLLDSLEIIIPVGVDIQWAEINGVTTENDILTKTLVDDFGTATIGNIVNAEGEVRVTVEDVNVEWSFGYSLIENSTDVQVQALALAADELDYGYSIDQNNTLYALEGGTATSVGTVQKGDVISIEKTTDQMLFKKNDAVLRQASYAPASTYRVRFSLASNAMRAGPIRIIRFYHWPRPNAVITHSDCYTANGAIDLQFSLDDDIYAVNWTGPNGFIANAEDISGLEVGVYTATITYRNFFGILITLPPKTYRVGYGVVWANPPKRQNAITGTASGELIKSAPIGDEQYGSSGASSRNLLVNTPSNTQWLEFGVTPILNQCPPPPPNAFCVFYNVFSIGLTSQDANFSVSDIEYGLHFGGVGLPNQPNGYGFRLRPIVGGVVLPFSSTVPGYTYNPSDKFRIEHDGNFIKFYKNENDMYPGLTIPAPSSDLIVDAALAMNTRGIAWAATSFNCADEPFIYGHPLKKLDGGIYRVVNGKIYLKYREEYNTGDFTFNIYNDDNELKATQNDITVNTFNGYGDNRIEIPVVGGGVNLAQGYYILEVINNKDEKWYLRVKYEL